MRFKVLLGATLIAAISWTAIPTQAAFPGTNGKIAYARYPRGSSPYEEIYSVNPDGTEEQGPFRYVPFVPEGIGPEGNVST
nr:hypothetical protein [Actinomycetota bacterium]